MQLKLDSGYLLQVGGKGCCQGFLGHFLTVVPPLDCVGGTLVLHKPCPQSSVRCPGHCSPGSSLYLQSTPKPTYHVVSTELDCESVGKNNND